jgi:hypothetical protein
MFEKNDIELVICLLIDHKTRSRNKNLCHLSKFDIHPILLHDMQSLARQMLGEESFLFQKVYIFTTTS